MDRVGQVRTGKKTLHVHGASRALSYLIQIGTAAYKT